MSPSATTARGRRRREIIVDAATALFESQGFHGTSIDDIGVAAGISGPGLYRHFRGKDAILIAVFDRVWERLRPSIEEAATLPPSQALTTLVDAHLDMAIGDPSALLLLTRELRHVPDDYQRLARANHQRYVEAWARPLAERDRQLDEAQARAVALAVHGLIDSAARRADLAEPASRRVLLRTAAFSVLDLHGG